MSKVLTQEQFEKKFYSKYKGKYVIRGKYERAILPVAIECMRCHEIFYRTPNSCDRRNTSCPFCDKNGDTRNVHIGVDDIWTTRPDVAKNLKNSEDGYKYRFNTNAMLEFVCPLCGKERKCRPNYHKVRYICPYCSDNISYPNKLMANLLYIIGIPFETEYKIGKSDFRYDFYFRLNDKKYLIEMDGYYGHGHIDTTNKTTAEQILIDKEKDSLAENNGYILIRIDCAYRDQKARKDYICKNVLKSPLSVLFPLTSELLDEADMASYDSQVVNLATAWNKNIRTYDDLMKILRVKSRTAVRNYARQAIDLELISMDYNGFLKEVRLASNKKLAQTKGTPVYCEQLKKAFYSISEAERVLKLSSLRCYFSHNRNYCGMLPDGTKLTWKKLTQKEYQALKKNC